MLRGAAKGLSVVGKVMREVAKNSCKVCGEEISAERIERNPEAVTCSEKCSDEFLQNRDYIIKDKEDCPVCLSCGDVLPDDAEREFCQICGEGHCQVCGDEIPDERAERYPGIVTCSKECREILKRMTN